MNFYPATPLPPKTVLAKKKMHGMVTLTWQDEKPWRPVAVEYLILYHKDGEKLNKVRKMIIATCPLILKKIIKPFDSSVKAYSR